MRIYAFVRQFPVLFKPYYDAQFSDFVRRGHDLRIFAVRNATEPRSRAVIDFALERRTHLYPSTLSTLHHGSWRAAKFLAGYPRMALARLGKLRRPLEGGLAATVRCLSLQDRAPDVCVIHGLGTATQFTWLKRVFPSSAVAIYFHGGEVAEVGEWPPVAVSEAFGEADVVFTNTQASRTQAIERGCSPEKLVILPVGFTLRDFPANARQGYRRGGILRLISAGRLSEEKGIDLALAAVHQLINSGISDLHYTIVGDGYLRPKLEAYVQKHALEPYVTFTGAVPIERVSLEMSKADVLLLPSRDKGRWAETQACAVQEALLMQALVIVTRHGGVPESIPPELDSFVVPQNDVNALADAIRGIAHLNVAETARLAAIGRAFVVSRYDVERLDDELVRVALERATARRNHSRPSQQ